MSSPRQRFKTSRLEIILGLAVICGLVYMVYLFGLDSSGQIAAQPPRLTSAAEATLSRIIVRQGEISEQVRTLLARLEVLSKSPGRPPELAGLKDELDSLSKSLDILEARLGEINSLLPPRSREEPKAPRGH